MNSVVHGYVTRRAPTSTAYRQYVDEQSTFSVHKNSLFSLLKQSHHNEILNVVIFFNFFLYNTAVTIPGCSKSPHYYDIIIDLMHMSSYNRLASWWVFCNKTKLYYIILTCNIFFSVLNSVIGVIDSPVVLDYWDS